MHDHEKSDRPVLPVKPPNNPTVVGAEVVEGRGLPEGNTAGETRPGRSAGPGVSSDLDRVQVARKDRDVRFTALLHHVSVDRLREAYRAISPNAAPGVDGVTWRDYGLDLEANLRDLHARGRRPHDARSPPRSRRRTARESRPPARCAAATEMRRRMHHPIPEQGRWLASVLQGHYNYYAVPDNSEALDPDASFWASGLSI